MVQLNAKDIFDCLKSIQENGTKLEDLQVYLGDDDEINGVHCAWSVDLIDKNSEEDEWIAEMIGESRHNLPLKNKAIFIS